MSKVRLTSRGSWTAHVFATIRISLFARELSPLAKMSLLGRTHFNGTGRSTDRLICMRRAGRLPSSQALERPPPRPPLNQHPNNRSPPQRPRPQFLHLQDVLTAVMGRISSRLEPAPSSALITSIVKKTDGSIAPQASPDDSRSSASWKKFDSSTAFAIPMLLSVLAIVWKGSVR